LLALSHETGATGGTSEALGAVAELKTPTRYPNATLDAFTILSKPAL